VNTIEEATSSPSLVAEEQAQQARRLLRHGLALGAVLMLGSLSGWPQAPQTALSVARSPDGKQQATGSHTAQVRDAETGGPAVTLGIEISLPNRAIFYIPVVGNEEILGIGPFPTGRFAGIRITPRMRADSVKIEVSALMTAKKKLLQATCNEVQSWNSEDAGSYERKKDESLLLSGLGRLGLPVFKVKVVRAHGPPPGGFHHPYANSSAFCGCEYSKPRSIIKPDGGTASGVAGTVSFPEAGKCVEISGCGQCCRISPP
jgi:hypothetical protein